MNEFEKVLTSCKFVVENAKHVCINEDMLDKFVKNFEMKKMPHWLSSNPFGLLDFPISEIVNLLIILESIDCSFWGEPKWTLITEENKSVDGAFALIYALLKLRKEKGHLDFERISFEEFKKVLTGNVEIPLLKERYQVVLEISKIINEKMNGNFYTFIKDITLDTELFKIILKSFPSFQDTRTYEGKTIYFYKLAQLVISDILHIREMKENIQVDYSHLVGCADYKIPQSLRGIGILEYDKELANLVDNKRELKENSIYEVEIRASMIVALNRIKERISSDITLIELNDILWSLGQGKDFAPYYRTRTMSY